MTSHFALCRKSYLNIRAQTKWILFSINYRNTLNIEITKSVKGRVEQAE